MFKKYPKNFFVLFVGQTISNLGNQIYLIGLPWLVYELTKSSLQMGSIAAVTALPDILFALFVGVLVDKYNKKKIIWFTSVLQFLLVMMIPILFILNILEIYHIYIIGFLYSTTSLIFVTCYRSSIPELVEEKYLVEVNSLIQLSLTVIRMVGPIIAGFIIAFMGEINGFFVDAVTYFILIVCISFIKMPTKPIVNGKKTRLLDDIKEGFKYTFGTVELRYITWIVLVVNIGMSISLSLMIFHLRGENNLLANEVGYVYSIAGIISFCLTLLAPRIGKLINNMQAIAICCCVSGVGLLLLPMMNHIVSNGLALGMVTGGATLGTVFINTVLQKQVSIAYLGRVYATTQMATRISVPLALMIGAWGSETYLGIGGMFTISGLIIVISTLAGLFRINNMKKEKQEEMAI